MKLLSLKDAAGAGNDRSVEPAQRRFEPAPDGTTKPV